MFQRKNKDEEAKSKVHLVDMTSNYGATKDSPCDQRLENPFGENYQEDTSFWQKVTECHKRVGGDKIDIEMRLRLERIDASCKTQGKDTLIELITNVYDDYKKRVDYEKKFGNKEDAEIFDTFVRQLSEFAIIIIKEDYNGYTDFLLSPDLENSRKKQIAHAEDRGDSKRKYANLIQVKENSGETSVLHLAAQNNLCGIAEFYMKMYPGSVLVDDKPSEDDDIPARTPIEWALLKEHDDVCSLLMKSTLNERVRKMFQGTMDTVNNQFRRADYSLHELIRKQNMKKTINAVLDSCVNPNFPFIAQDPEEKKQQIKEVWSKMGGTLPLRYHFYFQLLDGDDEGKPPKFYDDSMKRYVPSPFRSFSSSVFQLIADHADSSNKQDPIKHPVIRQLQRHKWNKYGQTLLILQALMYVFFLIALSLALGLGADSKEPTRYQTNLDRFRGFCEIISILFSFAYLGLEIEQFIRSKRSYVCDIYNVFDLGGILSIIILIPCRYKGSLTITRSISVIAFFINFLRVFKFFPISEDFGPYAKTFMKIIVSDIYKFVVILSVVLMAFAGSVYLALTASRGFNDDIGNFWHVFVQEMRAIAEGKEFADSYSGYHVVFTLFMLINMFFVIVVLGNILIGQISNRYNEAQAEATIQNDIDRAKMLVELDRSFLTYKKRINHYREGIYVKDQEIIEDLIVDWNALQKTEEVQKSVKSMIKKRILKIR